MARLFIVLIVLPVGTANGKTSPPSVCKGQDEVVVVKLPAPREDALLVKCDKTSDLSQPEARPFSRVELARLYNETRGNSPREEHAEKWKTTFGITQESLRAKISDIEIGQEILQFPQSEDLAAIRKLASQISETQGISNREVTIGKDLSMQEFESGRLRLFAGLCEQSGGHFAIPAKFLEEFQLGGRSSLEGTAVCNCHGKVFSNPIDYQCNSKGERKASGERLFRERANPKGNETKPAASGATGK